MAGRLTRFLNLERPRPGEPAAPRAPVNEARFTPDGTPVLPLSAQEEIEALRLKRERFVDSGVELAQPSEDQPFLRCPVCEADNSRFAPKCMNCGTDLTTEAVLAWNQKFWAERRAEEPPAAREPPAGGDHSLGETLAREVAEQERARPGWWRSTADRVPLGVSLLRSLPPDQATSAGVALLAAFLAGLAAVVLGGGHAGVQFLGGGLALLLVLLFLPRRS